ncbi:MAG: suppressor of fused domain protein, partial [Terriglobales bacterium]
NGRNELYKELFGEPSYVSPANYAAPSPLTRKKKKVDLNTVHGGSGDPGDPEAEEQHLAILAYGPDPTRPFWTYVTAGLSSPWLQEAPDEVSGFACELMIKSPTDAAWPAQILRSLAYYIFNHAGTISPSVRIGLNAPIKEHSDSLLRNLFVWYADEAPDTIYALRSGGFGLFCVVGITDEELRWAESVEEYGTWCIQEAMRRVGLGQVSDPDRRSVITADNTEMLNGVKLFANSFRADLSMRGGENE